MGRETWCEAEVRFESGGGEEALMAARAGKGSTGAVADAGKRTIARVHRGRDAGERRASAHRRCVNREEAAEV